MQLDTDVYNHIQIYAVRYRYAQLETDICAIR